MFDYEKLPSTNQVLIFIVCCIMLKLCTKEEEREKCPSDYDKVKIMPFEYKALVTKKYIDTANHRSRRVFIDNKGESINISFSGYQVDYASNTIDQRTPWERIDVGDSIFKEKGALDLLLKKKEYVLSIKFKCNLEDIPNW